MAVVASPGRILHLYEVMMPIICLIDLHPNDVRMGNYTYLMHLFAIGTNQSFKLCPPA